MQVKGNEPKLYQDMQMEARISTPIDQYLTCEQQKGRTEYREVSIFPATPAMKALWAGLKTYIVVINTGIRDQKPYYEEHFYISSWENSISAKVYGQKVRAHWGIENTNHYQKDVFLREDTNGIAHINAASCIAICNDFVVNVTGVFNFKSIKLCHNTLKNNIKQSIEYLRI